MNLMAGTDHPEPTAQLSKMGGASGFPKITVRGLPGAHSHAGDMSAN